MNSVRMILSEVKKIKGLRTDAQLADEIGVPLHTMRGWIQNDSIRRQLIAYCGRNSISIDEVVFGERRFAPQRCEACHRRDDCDEFQRAVGGELTIPEDRYSPRTVTLEVAAFDETTVDLYADTTLKRTFSSDLEGVDTIVVRLRP